MCDQDRLGTNMGKAPKTEELPVVSVHTTDQAVEVNAAADAVTDAVIAAPDAWRHLVGGGTADDATATAGADAAPSPPATRSAMRAAAAAAAQLRASSG
jgi:hypothetical protein